MGGFHRIVLRKLLEIAARMGSSPFVGSTLLRSNQAFGDMPAQRRASAEGLLTATRQQWDRYLPGAVCPALQSALAVHATALSANVE